MDSFGGPSGPSEGDEEAFVMPARTGPPPDVLGGATALSGQVLPTDEVGDAERRRVADVDRAHGDHQRPAEGAGRAAGRGGAVHRHVHVLLDEALVPTWAALRDLPPSPAG